MGQRFAFIVGAPRCGTTSLAAFLQQHPDVCFSLAKEPHYFSRFNLSRLDEAEARRQADQDYLVRFFPHRDEQALLAEGSVSYLYAAERMDAVLRLWPEAKFVIAVRDPMAMLPSLHQRLLYLGDETEPDFERAWRLMRSRAEGRRIPRTCLDPRMLQYAEAGRLGAYVDRFFRTVGRERCMVVVFDDLVRRPQDVARQLTDFLGLAPQLHADLSPRRASLGCRSLWLHRLLKRPPVATRMVLAGATFRQRIKPLKADARDPALVRAILSARKKLLDWNKAPPPPVILSSMLRKEIRELLSGDVALLSRLIDRDLSHWLDGAAANQRDLAPAHTTAWRRATSEASPRVALPQRASRFAPSR